MDMTFKEAREYLRPIADNTPLTGYGAALETAMKALEQADKIVHCCECKNHYASYYGVRNKCVLTGVIMPPHGFCYYGERRAE